MRFHSGTREHEYNDALRLSALLETRTVSHYLVLAMASVAPVCSAVEHRAAGNSLGSLPSFELDARAQGRTPLFFGEIRELLASSRLERKRAVHRSERVHRQYLLFPGASFGSPPHAEGITKQPEPLLHRTCRRLAIRLPILTASAIQKSTRESTWYSSPMQAGWNTTLKLPACRSKPRSESTTKA